MIRMITLILISYITTTLLAGEPDLSSEFTGNPPVEIHNYLRLDEKLTYVVKWNGFPIGKVVSSVWPICRDFSGNNAFLFQLFVETNDFVSVFYKIRTNLSSLVDADNGWSYLFRRRVQEGGYRGNDRVEFDYYKTDPLGNVKAQAEPALIRWEKVEKLKPYSLPGKVCDPVSMIWYLRAIPLQRKGDYARIMLADRYGLAVVGWRVMANKQLYLPLMGSYDCTVITPDANSYDKGENLLKDIKGIEVWLEVNTRIIMRATADTPYGRLSVTLMASDNTKLKEFKLY